MRIPNRDTASEFFRCYVILGGVFLLVYGGTNYLTESRSPLHRFYFDWESHIPFVPGFIYVYLSIFLVFFLPLFSLSARKIRALAAAFLVAVISAGIVFLLLPAQSNFVRPALVPNYKVAFDVLYALDLPRNLFPSLHVTSAMLFIGITADEEKSIPLRILLSIWLASMLVSVLLVRQHQLMDIFGGIALAALCYRIVYRRLAD